MPKSQEEQLRRIGMLAIVQNRSGVFVVVRFYEGRYHCITQETMPAVASFEDLKAPQKEGLSLYAMPYALCSMLQGAANWVEEYV